MAEQTNEKTTIYTIGHSTMPAEDFIGILKDHSITLVADVRSVPGSRHNPQFSKAAIASALGARCIAYVHMVGLGGFRKADAGSDANAGWKNNAFRGYADYMQTPSFEESLGGLIEMAERGTVCIMCAETVPWRCHRSLLSDALTARGVEVVHIMGDGADHPHRVTDFALLEGERVTYPGEMTLS